MSGITLKQRTSAEIPVPAAGKRTIFVDSADGNPKYKDDAGVVHAFPSVLTEDVQDIIGALITDSNSIDATYNDAGAVETLEALLNYGGAVTGAARTYLASERGLTFERSNAGSPMNDILPALTPADKGYWIKVHNVGTVVGETLTFTTGAGTFSNGGASFVLNFGCRQTFVWTGTRWIYDAGNANIPKVSGTGWAVGQIPQANDSTGRNFIASAINAANWTRGWANVLDFGADPTGATSSEAAITAAVASLGSGGGTLFFPAGTYLLVSQPYIISANQVIVKGAGPGQTFIKTNNTTGDQLRVTGYGSRVEDLNIAGPGTGTTSNKTSGYGLDIQSTEGRVTNVEFAYQYDSCGVNGHLVDVRDTTCRYFKNTGIWVAHNSDHRITGCLMVNATAPNLAGIHVTLTASLVLEQLNIINCKYALNIAPGAGVTIPSVKGTDCFFDSSDVGLNMTAAGFLFRTEFTNCWFSTMTTAGVRFNPTTAGGVNGVTFVNCDIYNNVAGTTIGLDTNTNVAKWKMVGCSIAGWTTGINLVAGAAHFPTILSNTIGSVSAFGVNTTGVAIGAGTYSGLVLANNDVVDNTTAFTLGALTIAAASATAAKFRIIDNAGINPKGAVTAPAAAPVSATTYVNNTGFRVLVMFRTGATTAPTNLTINGVSSVLPAAGQLHPIVLEPGGTIAYTGTVAATWTWIGQ